MFTFFKFSIRGIWVGALAALTVHALAQVTPPATGASVLLPLSTKQQASLGVQVAAVQASTGGQLLASATVVMPPGSVPAPPIFCASATPGASDSSPPTMVEVSTTPSSFALTCSVFVSLAKFVVNTSGWPSP